MSDSGLGYGAPGSYQFTFGSGGTAESAGTAGAERYYAAAQPPQPMPMPMNQTQQQQQQYDVGNFVSGGVSYPSLPAQPPQPPQPQPLQAQYGGGYYAGTNTTGGHTSGASDLVNVTYSDQQYNNTNHQSQLHSQQQAPRRETSGGGNVPAGRSASGGLRYKMTFKGEFGETQPVYCEIGMDGLKLVDTFNGSTIETFPLKIISRWAVRDKDTFLFWSVKESEGGKQRQVELKGTSKDVSNILDTITAACMQLCEMIDKEDHQKKIMGLAENSSEEEEECSSSTAEKKGFVGWIAGKVKPGQSDDGIDSATAIPEGVEYWKQPDYDGWMQSQGEHIKTWRKRWWVLKDGYLFRFLNDKVLPQSKPRGVINLGTCLEISKPSKDANQGATIQVTVQKKRSLGKGDLLQNILLVADSKAERDLWLQIMNRAKTDIITLKEKSEKDSSAKKGGSSRGDDKYSKAVEWLTELEKEEERLAKNKKERTVEVHLPSAPSPQQHQHQPPQQSYGGHVHQHQQHTQAYAQQHTQPQSQPQSSSPITNWKVCYTPDGSVYYYNTQTGVTQWEAPN